MHAVLGQTPVRRQREPIVCKLSQELDVNFCKSSLQVSSIREYGALTDNTVS